MVLVMMKRETGTDLGAHGSCGYGTCVRQALTLSCMILVMMESEIDTDLAVHGSGNDGTYVRQALTSARMEWAVVVFDVSEVCFGLLHFLSGLHWVED